VDQVHAHSLCHQSPGSADAIKKTPGGPKKKKSPGFYQVPTNLGCAELGIESWEGNQRAAATSDVVAGGEALGVQPALAAPARAAAIAVPGLPAPPPSTATRPPACAARTKSNRLPGRPPDSDPEPPSIVMNQRGVANRFHLKSVHPSAGRASDPPGAARCAREQVLAPAAVKSVGRTTLQSGCAVTISQAPARTELASAVDPTGTDGATP